jgi:hypothetical protein
VIAELALEGSKVTVDACPSDGERKGILGLSQRTYLEKGSKEI